MLLSEVFAELDESHIKATETRDMKALAEVSHRFEKLLNDFPGDLGILFKIGTCKHQLGLNGSAIVYLSQAAMLKPDTAEIWNNLASAWKGENHDENARQCWERAIEIEPKAEHYNNIGTLYVNVGEPAEGVPFLEKALELEPDMARAKWNMSLLQLEMGNWEAGFSLYDYGIASMDRPDRNFQEEGVTPMWDGEPGTVVVYGEQGMGDEIMWASCLPDIAAEANRVIVECHPRLENLLRRSFPELTYYGTRKDPTLVWPNDDPPDYRIPMGSLFKRYRLHGEFPQKPYLEPNPNLTEHYRKRLKETGDPPYIGIAWAAGGKSTRKDFRSFKLGFFEPIFEIPATWISLQYTHDASGKVERHNAQKSPHIHHWRTVVEAQDGNGTRCLGYDYDHTAALINALDLCILPNTTAVHLCGAIGKECWTLTPKGCAWRYQLEGDRVPFYGDWVTQIREQDNWAEIVSSKLSSWVTDRAF